MARQHCTPLLLRRDQRDAVALQAVGGQLGEHAVSEAEIQAFVQAHPTSLPIREIDPMFVGAVPICTELATPAGSIDNFLVTPTGLPVLVECKLWRNPEGRREVVGQILDYAKELSRWSSSDVQREVARRLKRDGNPLLELVRAAEPDLDEAEFNDALTANLRRGRFLLLIVGDGIREGVEAIAEYLQAHAGLHFTLGLIELPIYLLPNGDRLIAPRVLTRTMVLTRTVVAVPEGFAVDADAESDADPDRSALTDAQQQFWSSFFAKLQLDDPEQAVPRPPRQGYFTLTMPAPSGTCWLTVYRDLRANEVGVFLSSQRGTVGEYAMLAITDDADNVLEELGGTARLSQAKDGRPRIVDSFRVASLSEEATREQAFDWLADRVNTFVNVMRPRVRSAVADHRTSNQDPA